MKARTRPAGFMSGHAAATTVLVLATLLYLSGCGATPSSATVIRTLYNPGQDGFDNLLVISVAGDYRSRAELERMIAQAIIGGEVSAAAYFTVVGRNPQFTRAYIHDAIRARGFDGLVFVREKGQEQEELAPMRPVGRNFDLFGYDYGELNRDVQVREARAITFVTEVYDTATQLKVWSIETLSTDITTLQSLIAEQAHTIASQLREDGLLRR